jgi:5-methylcytosine-specific restriction endonuclease McrBC regulatory subunit McrC
MGITKGYRPEPYRGYFRPKVNFGQTVSRHLSRGDQVNVSSDVFSFSARLHINGILKSACLDLLRVIPRGPRWKHEHDLLLDALNALHNVDAIRMQFGDQALTAALPTWARDSYYGALSVYAVLLGFTRIGFPFEPQGSMMPSFLFKLDDVFEDFVRNALRAAYRAIGISIVDGNISRNQGTLFRDSRRFRTKPDIIFRRDRKGPPSAIGEVKYKPRLEEADRYQVISHVVSESAPIGIWISPALSSDESGMEYVGSIATGAKFYHYRINIASNLKLACSEMARSISELIS